MNSHKFTWNSDYYFTYYLHLIFIYFNCQWMMKKKSKNRLLRIKYLAIILEHLCMHKNNNLSSCLGIFFTVNAINIMVAYRNSQLNKMRRTSLPFLILWRPPRMRILCKYLIFNNYTSSSLRTWIIQALSILFVKSIVFSWNQVYPPLQQLRSGFRTDIPSFSKKLIN